MPFAPTLPVRMSSRQGEDMAARQRIVVVGGSLAGYSAISELVMLVPDSDIVWVTGETSATYSKPALSKEFMQGRNSLADLTLPGIDAAGKRLSIVRGRACAALDVDNHSLCLADGEAIAFGHLLICTGANARMPAMFDGVEGISALRTLEDAIGIRARLESKPRVLVIGGGLIGCEFAASMRMLGLEATIVERLDTLLERPFGGALSDYFLNSHRDNGVEVVLGATIDRLVLDNGKAAGVALVDGTVIEAGLIVVGAGSQPTTQWLEGSGLTLEDGIACDAFLRTSDPDIHAAGDVARWHNRLFGMTMRVEHWTNASAQGRAAARNVAAAVTGDQDLARPFEDVPYFWSDQYGQKIQMVGWHEGHDRVETVQSDNDTGSLTHFYRDGVLIAAAAVNMPRAIMRLKGQIAAQLRESK